VEFLLLIPVIGILAQLWVSFRTRTRRAPGIEETIGRHQRAIAAMNASVGSHVSEV
jgi:hypothetical protein